MKQATIINRLGTVQRLVSQGATPTTELDILVNLHALRFIMMDSGWKIKRAKRA